LNIGRHLYSAGRPSRWAFAHILVLSFFVAYSQRSESGCLPYFRTWCGISANLECWSEVCCMQLTEIQDAKICQKSPSAHRHTILSGYIFASKASIDNREKAWHSQQRTVMIIFRLILWTDIISVYWRGGGKLSSHRRLYSYLCVCARYCRLTQYVSVAEDYPVCC